MKPNKQLLEVVKNAIDLEGYDLESNVRNFFEVFRSEYDFEIKRRGEKRALVEYLMCLPSGIDLPFYYFDIAKMLYSLEMIENDDVEHHLVNDGYFPLIAECLMTLNKLENVPV